MKSVFGKSRASCLTVRVTPSEQGRGHSLHGEAMCHLSACPVTPRQTGLEPSPIYTTVGSLPGGRPFLFCITESI